MNQDEARTAAKGLDGSDQQQEAERTAPRRRNLTRELVEMIVLTVVIFFGMRAAVQSFRVEGFSMAPTLQSNELLIVNKAVYWRVPDDWPVSVVAQGSETGNGSRYVFHAPQRGDIIVFRAPVSTGSPGEDYIKRVIGLPGDVVTIRGGHVSINGRTLSEPYVHREPTVVGDFDPHRWVVPRGRLFVLGDNRENSYDSRYWGYVPIGNVIGKAEFAYWPLDRFGDVAGLFVLDVGSALTGGFRP